MNYKTVTTLSGFAAVLAASTIAVGSTMGFHSLTGSWLTACLIGFTIAIIVGIGWHVLIRSASNTRYTFNRFGLVAVGLVLVAIAIATSGWALATKIGGKSAIEYHQKAALSEYEAALSDAVVRINGQRPLVEAVSVARSVYSGRVGAEIAGDNGTPGCGPQCRQLQAVSANLGEFQSGISAQIEEGLSVYEGAGVLLASARSAVGTPAFSDALVGVEGAIVRMNGVNVLDGVSTVGMTSGNSNDALTAQIVAVAEGLDVTPVPLPRYIPMNEAQATIAYAPDVAGAWIAAFAIDASPLIFLLLVLMLHAEPLIRQQPDVVRKPKPTADEIRVREDNVIGLRREPAE